MWEIRENNMAVSFEKKLGVSRAYRFFLAVPGGNVSVVTDIVEREDGTTWIVSPLGGISQSKMTYDETVACVTAIESANGSLKKSGPIETETSSLLV